MTVYTNVLRLSGQAPEDSVFSAVHGWIKQLLGHHIVRKDIFRTETLEGTTKSGKPVKSRSYRADRTDPKLYAWRIGHPDNSVRDRYWNIEIGCRVEEHQTTFSVNVETSDANVLVVEPIAPSRPRVVRYLVDDISEREDVYFAVDMPSREVKTVHESEHFFRALEEEIHRDSRSYPIVLVSPHPLRGYLVDVGSLSSNLVGLAQVVAIDSSCDTFQLEEYLTRRYSAFGGAVNIIYPKYRSIGVIRSKRIMQEELENLSSVSGEQLVLGYVTAVTNSIFRGQLITANVVDRENLRRNSAKRIEEARREWDKTANHEQRAEFEELLSLADEEKRSLDQELREEQEKREQAEQLVQAIEEKYSACDSKKRTLEYQLSQVSGRRSADTDEETYTTLAEWIEVLSKATGPEPEESLSIIQTVFGDQVEILPEAWKTAEQSRNFRRGITLLRLLFQLVNEYLPAYLEGGDDKARAVFGTHYASKESDTTIKNKSMRNERTFMVNETEVLMQQHLKIGSASDTAETIRVYFCIDQERRRVVIGHCGPHLTVSGY